MLYFGMFLVIFGVFSLIELKKTAKDEKAKKNTKISVIVLFVIAVPCIFWGLKGKSKNFKNKNVKITYTLQDFEKLYSEKAKKFNAKSDFDWTVKEGEKGDSVTLKINSSGSELISLNKNPEHTIQGIFVLIDTENQLEMFNTLCVLYGTVSVFEPKKTPEEIMSFVQKILSLSEGEKLSSNNVDYSLKTITSNIISICLLIKE